MPIHRSLKPSPTALCTGLSGSSIPLLVPGFDLDRELHTRAGGLRKVRWSRQGMGKRGGARVIYFSRLAHGVIALLMVYTKAKFDALPTVFLLQLKKEFEDV